MRAMILSVMGVKPLITEDIRDKIYTKCGKYYKDDSIRRKLNDMDGVYAVPYPNKHNGGSHNRWRIA